MPSSCDAVFKVRPRSYNYSLSTSQIPREEALMLSSDEDEEQTDEISSELSQNRQGHPSLAALSAEKYSSTQKLSLQNASVPFCVTPTQEIIPPVEFIDGAERPADLIEERGFSIMDNTPSFATDALPSDVGQS